ncbi:MAG: hypothetical protein KBT47_02840, partial [Armatimonadetes bacterium]|nr:hypothetical protein [Candidatus Hippobium faecium]
PMALFGIAVEGTQSPLIGSMHVDNISVTVEATPRESVLSVINQKDDVFNKAWGEYPEISIKGTNYSKTDVGNLTYNFKVYDLYNGEKLTDEKSVSVDLAKAGETFEKSVTFNVPYGYYRADWSLSDGEGQILAKSFTFTAMRERCGTDLSPALENYLAHCGYWGGVFWQCKPDQGRDAGARWIRGFGSEWKFNEYEKGKYRFDKLKEYVKDYKDAGINMLLLTTLYENPEWYEMTDPYFAKAYGNYFDALSKEKILHWYEFGNEDNGATKLIYSEIARNAAACVRKNDGTALTANSGTAFVDISWFNLQKERNLFDRLDVLITHPYTVTSSPEEWGVYDQGQNMINIIDSVGGYKDLWSTEFGYSIGGDGYIIPDTTRADYIVRHFLVEVAAGYTKPGLYSWDGHFGIYNNETGSCSLVAVQNMAKCLEGYRYAGFLGQNDSVWAVVYEKLGKDPIVVAWDCKRESSFNINHTKVLDIFGREIKTDGNNVTISHSPVYIYGAGDYVTETAWKNTAGAELDRVNSLADTDYDINTSPEKLMSGLLKITGKIYDSREMSAAQFHLLKALMTMARYTDIPFAKSKVSLDSVKKKLEDIRLKDMDLPRLRWAYTQAENLDYELQFAKEQNAGFAKNLDNAKQFILSFGDKYFTDKRENVQNQVWAYLYTYEKDGKSLCEKLSFVPGAPARVECRVNNYANKACTAEVSLSLPDGWTCEPQVQKINLKPGADGMTYFNITAAASEENKFSITTKVDIKGRPTGTAVMNEIELLAPIILTQIPMDDILPDAPLKFSLKNVDLVPHSGEVTVCMTKDRSVIGKFDFEAIESENTVICQMPVNENIKYASDWDMYATVKLDNGMTSRVDFTCDFSVATKAAAPITIDGDLSDWDDALPLSLNKIDYTNNSFGGSWSPEDLSGKIYYKWDDKYLYMAADIKDQTFNQGLTGMSVWMQDSVQFALVPKEKPKKFYEYIMAFTPEGEQILMDYFENPAHEGLRGDIPFKVKLSQGRACYELAIPWEGYTEEFGTPAPGREFFYDILLNDDDAVTPRRYMERFSINIVHNKSTEGFGVLKLIDKTVSPLNKEEKEVVFRENFDTYGDGNVPDTWTVRPKGDFWKAYIAAGYGKEGSDALFLTSDRHEEDRYILLQKTVTVEPGAEYELSCLIKGSIPEGLGNIGVCSDNWGNQDMSYMEIQGDYPDWTEVKMRFSSNIPTRNIIIRNNTVMNLLVDNIKVTKVR